MRGTIQRWDVRRGFGFIENSETGMRLFCHISRVIGLDGDYLTPGTRVEYEEGISKRNNEPEAKNVRVLEFCNVMTTDNAW